MEQKYKITKMDREMFFLKIGCTVWVNYDEMRVYSEDKKQYMPLDIAMKLGLDGERVQDT